MSTIDKKRPVRMCIACRKGKEKCELLRIVRGRDGKFYVDESRKAQGRGTYVCADEACIKKAKKIFPKVMRREMDDQLFEALEKAVKSDGQ